jgi:hypothetical protein
MGNSNNVFCCVHTLPKAEECRDMSCNQLFKGKPVFIEASFYKLVLKE